MTAQASFTIRDRWSTGLVGEIAILNDASAENGWTVSFDAGFAITNFWNAELVSQVGSRYTFRNASWNGSVAPGGTTSFGFQGGGSTAEVTNLVFAGATEPPPAPVLPRISVADAQVSEGSAGEQLLSFTVSLSAAATSPVTVNFATANGTALAGQDFVGTSGTLTLAAGQTSQTVTVRITGDTAVEANETFFLNLSGAAGATIADGQATGTIVNDDSAPTPPPSAAGFLSTSGNQIVDSAGKPFQLNAVNWFGMETTRFAPDGLHVRNYKDMMDQMKALGFNAVRLPFSGQSMDEGASNTPNGINYSLNPELAGLRGAALLDKIVEYAGQIGLKILLDHHRSSAGDGPNPNGLWYDGTYTEPRWISMWERLAERYASNPTVIGADLQNEPHGANWADWAGAAERAGNAIHGRNPNWLIVVEGVGQYNNNHYWWGGNLMGVRDRPVDLALDNKLVYSPHDYPNSIYAQPWFNEPGFPNNLPAKFDQMWGFIYKNGTAPIFLGEFGTKLTDPKDQAWLQKITAYLDGDLDGNGTIDIPAGKSGMSWAWWSWNPNSGDTGGILQDDWRSVQQAKLNALLPIMDGPDAGTRPAGAAARQRRQWAGDAGGRGGRSDARRPRRR
jgi:aryl-phospho-beta-D-glucosidase BglC (GH1 family)